LVRSASARPSVCARIWRAGFDERIMAVRKRFWTLLVRREGRFPPEFGSFVRGDVIVKMSELRRKGVARSDLKISVRS
jgi:hypothetical protein